jgi:hypothetical protein
LECPNCKGRAERVLGLVKDGTVYEAYRCACGHHQVTDTRQDRLPVDLDREGGVNRARVSCGTNCYIFDRRMFRLALRQVLRACRSRPGDLILDLSRVGLVADGLLSAVRFLAHGLERRGHRLFVVAPGSGVGGQIEALTPALAGCVFRDEDAARAAAGARDLAAGHAS